MNIFFVGQRVRVVNDNLPGGKRYSPHASCFIGCEATIRGTPSCPNAGFNPALGTYSIQPDGYFRCGMVYGFQLEPIIPLAARESIEQEEEACPN